MGSVGSELFHWFNWGFSREWTEALWKSPWGSASEMHLAEPGLQHCIWVAVQCALTDCAAACQNKGKQVLESLHCQDSAVCSKWQNVNVKKVPRQFNAPKCFFFLCEKNLSSTVQGFKPNCDLLTPLLVHDYEQIFRYLRSDTPVLYHWTGYQLKGCVWGHLFHLKQLFPLQGKQMWDFLVTFEMIDHHITWSWICSGIRL